MRNLPGLRRAPVHHGKLTFTSAVHLRVDHQFLSRRVTRFMIAGLRVFSAIPLILALELQSDAAQPKWISQSDSQHSFDPYITPQEPACRT